MADPLPTIFDVIEERVDDLVEVERHYKIGEMDVTETYRFALRMEAEEPEVMH